MLTTNPAAPMICNDLEFLFFHYETVHTCKKVSNVYPINLVTLHALKHGQTSGVIFTTRKLEQRRQECFLQKKL